MANSTNKRKGRFADRAGRSKRRVCTQRRPGFDPIIHLNHDILHTIFDFLPFPDIIRCQRLNKAWYAISTEWVERNRVRIGRWLRPDLASTMPSTFWTTFSVDELKSHGSRLHRTQLGKATSMLEFNSTADTTMSGRYFATVKDIVTGFGDSMTWGSIEIATGGISVNGSTIAAITLRGKHRPASARVNQMQVNKDGLILVDVTCVQPAEIWIIVYAPAQQRPIFEYITGLDDNRCYPLALGRSRVYLLLMNHKNSGKAQIVAVDLHTGREMYRLTAPTGSLWDPPLLNPYRYRDYLEDNVKLHQLVHATGDEELLIMETRAISDSWLGLKRRMGKVDIIRGRDGCILHRISCQSHKSVPLGRCLTDPITKQMVFSWSLRHPQIPLYLAAEHPLLWDFTVTVFRTFTYDPSAAFQTLSDAVVVFHGPAPPAAEVLNPFAMQAIGFHAKDRESATPWASLTRRPFVSPAATKYLHAAEALTDFLFPAEEVEVKAGDCFRLGRAKAITLPARVAEWLQRSDTMHVGTDGDPQLHLVDLERVLVVYPEYAVLLGFE
ncbi:hypothetical protein BJX70DRAFT_399623 [Aspergillus crustosus]